MKGFGDFVPGQNQDDPYATPKLVLGAIYVLFGMAILAMCFDLMQEEIIAKFTWLGKKLGIIEKDEEDEAEELAEKEKEKEKKEKEKMNQFDNGSSKKEKPIFMSEKSNFNSNSPAPSYSATAKDHTVFQRFKQ